MTWIDSVRTWATSAVTPEFFCKWKTMEHLIFASYGNDSIALIQWAHERGLTGVHVAYGDTGWAAEWWPARVEQVAARNARNVTYRSKIRADVLNAYGGKCECCGESHPEFLALDHINGGGGKERRTVAGNTSGGVYRLARNAGYPKDKYRLLCHNCNCAIGWYGYCPHQKENSCG